MVLSRFFKSKKKSTYAKEHHVKSGFEKMHSSFAKSFENVRSDTTTISRWLNYLNQKIENQEKVIVSQSKKIGELNSRVQHSHYVQSESLSELSSSVQKQSDNMDYHVSRIHNQNLKMKSEFNQLNSMLSDPSFFEGHIKHVLETYYAYNDIVAHINHFHKKINEFSERKVSVEGVVSPEFEEKLSAIHSRLESLEKKKEQVKSNLREKLMKSITRNSKDYVKNIIFSTIRKYGKITALQLKEMVVDEQGLCSKSSFYRLLTEIEQDSEVSTIMDGRMKSYMVGVIKNN